MTDQLDFPTIESASTAVSAPAPEGAVDIAKISITDVALAQFGPWEKQVADATKTLTGVVHDFSTTTKIKEGKSLRERIVNAPKAETRKISTAVKSTLTATNKAVTARENEIIAAWDKVDALITPQIEAADAKLEAERQERAQKEADRVAAHEARFGIFHNVVTRAQGLPSERIAAAITAVENTIVDPAEWEEFAARAEVVKSETLTKLRDMHAKAAEAERVEAQRLENERIAEEQRVQREALEKAQRELEAERRRLADIEEKRVARIDARLANLAAKRAYTADQTVDMINAAILELSSQRPTEDLYAEKLEQGAADHADALAHLQSILPAAIEREQAAEVARLRLAAEAAVAAPIPEPVAAPAVIPVAAPVSQVRQPDPAPEPAEEEPNLRLGEIALRLGFSVGAEFLSKLGFHPTPVGAGKYYRESQFGAICSAIADHTLKVAAVKSLEKAA